MKEINGSKCGFPLTCRHAAAHLFQFVESQARTAASILSANRGRRRFTTAVGRGLARRAKRAAVQKLNSWMHNASEGVPCQDCFVRGNFMPKEAQLASAWICTRAEGPDRVSDSWQLCRNKAQLGRDRAAVCHVLRAFILWCRVARFVERLRQ